MPMAITNGANRGLALIKLLVVVGLLAAIPIFFGFISLRMEVEHIRTFTYWNQRVLKRLDVPILSPYARQTEVGEIQTYQPRPPNKLVGRLELERRTPNFGDLSSEDCAELVSLNDIPPSLYDELLSKSSWDAAEQYFEELVQEKERFAYFVGRDALESPRAWIAFFVGAAIPGVPILIWWRARQRRRNQST